MSSIFDWKTGSLILISYGTIVWAISAVFGRLRDKRKDSFLVANRKIGVIEGSFSIAATWIWAPALFVSSSKAYLNGWIGLFWFTVPNIACLIIFSYFAAELRTKCPQGYTLSGFIKDKVSSRVQKLYIIELLSLSTCAFAVQLLAAGLVMSFLTTLSYHIIILFITVLALSYSLVFGLKASIVTDYFQMLLILGACIIFLPGLFDQIGGFEKVKLGLNGTLDQSAWKIFLDFGLPVTIGLLSGPFGDQSFWQRTFAIRKDKVKSSFILGACIFGIVPICLGMIGFIATGTGLPIKEPQIVNAEVIAFYMPDFIIILFLAMILSGLVSTMDSCICAFSSIFGHDIRNEWTNKINPVFISKVGMICLCVIAICITYIPGIKIVYLFLFYGTLRSSVLIPTMISIKSSIVQEAPIFWGILFAFIVGLPFFVTGQLIGNIYIKLFGSILTVLTPGVFYLLYIKRSSVFKFFEYYSKTSGM